MGKPSRLKMPKLSLSMAQLASLLLFAIRQAWFDSSLAIEHALAIAALKVMNPQSVDASSPKQRRFNPKQRETLREVGNIIRGALTEETGLQLRLAHTIYRGDGGFRGKPWQPLLASMPFLSSSHYCHSVTIDQFGGGRLSLFELTHSSVSDSGAGDGPK